MTLKYTRYTWQSLPRFCEANCEAVLLLSHRDMINKPPLIVGIHTTYIIGTTPPPRMPVANKGLGWDSLLKM